MWVFDGETWTDEGSAATDQVKRPNQNNPHFDEFYPELQVVEIVPVPRINYDVPPLPLP